MLATSKLASSLWRCSQLRTSQVPYDDARNVGARQDVGGCFLSVSVVFSEVFGLFVHVLVRVSTGSACVSVPRHAWSLLTKRPCAYHLYVRSRIPFCSRTPQLQVDFVVANLFRLLAPFWVVLKLKLKFKLRMVM
jgi:hypothetical protein